VKPGAAVADAAKDEGDAAAPVAIKRLMKVSDVAGSPEMTEVSSGDAIRRDQVTSADVFILGE